MFAPAFDPRDAFKHPPHLESPTPIRAILIVAAGRQCRFTHACEKNFAQRDEKASAINGASEMRGARINFCIIPRRAPSNYAQLMQISSMFFESVQIGVDAGVKCALNAL